MAKNTKSLLIAALASSVGMGLAMPAIAQGDGSVSDNPDLLRGSFSGHCPPAMLCHYGTYGGGTLARPSVSAATVSSAPLSVDPQIQTAPPQPAPMAYQPLVVEPAATSPWDLRARISALGRYIRSGDRERFEAITAPELEAIYAGARTQAGLTARAELTLPNDGDARISAAALSGTIRHALDSWTRVGAQASLRLAQPDRDGLDQRASGAMTAPLEFAGDVSVSGEYDFGQANLSGALRLERDIFDAPSNDDDRTGIGGTLRVSHALTPIVGVFGEGDVIRDLYDRSSAELGVSQDGYGYQLRGGISANWNDVLLAEASLGRGWRTFDDASLDDAQSWLYGASLTFNPTATLRLRAGLDTTLAATSESATAAVNVEHALTLEALYRVNSQLDLRASGGMRVREFVGTSEVERRYDAGVGADVAVGSRTSASLDYGYGLREDAAATTESRDEHRVTVGVTVER